MRTGPIITFGRHHTLTPNEARALGIVHSMTECGVADISQALGVSYDYAATICTTLQSKGAIVKTRQHGYGRSALFEAVTPRAVAPPPVSEPDSFIRPLTKAELMRGRA